MKKLRQISDTVEKLTRFIIVITFSIMIIACVLQVYTRYVLNTSLSWTEELARFTFIWTNLLGASLCVKYNAHATVTAVFEILPHKIKQYVLVFIQLVILAVSYVLIVPGIQFTMQVSRSVSPAMKLSMGLIYGAVPITGIFIVLYTLIYLIDTIVRMRGEAE